MAARPICGPPEPTLPALEQPYNILITGVGGTGVVTIGAMLGMAATWKARASAVIDHGRPGPEGRRGLLPCPHRGRVPEDIHAIRVACRLGRPRARLRHRRHRRQEALVAGMRRDDQGGGQQPVESMPGLHPRRQFLAALGAAEARHHFAAPAARTLSEFLDASRIATALMGNAIATNMFLLGHAFQIGGLIPLSARPSSKAIELNGERSKMNGAPSRWGRLCAVDPRAVELWRAKPQMPAEREASSHRPLDDIVARRVAFLTDYQDAAYAAAMPTWSAPCARRNRPCARFGKADRGGRPLRSSS
jgi:indolepyruvate ferredoxin oxidoreductase